MTNEEIKAKRAKVAASELINDLSPSEHNVLARYHKDIPNHQHDTIAKYHEKKAKGENATMHPFLHGYAAGHHYQIAGTAKNYMTSSMHSMAGHHHKAAGQKL